MSACGLEAKQSTAFEAGPACEPASVIWRVRSGDNPRRKAVWGQIQVKASMTIRISICLQRIMHQNELRLFQQVSLPVSSHVRCSAIKGFSCPSEGDRDQAASHTGSNSCHRFPAHCTNAAQFHINPQTSHSLQLYCCGDKKLVLQLGFAFVRRIGKRAWRFETLKKTFCD